LTPIDFSKKRGGMKRLYSLTIALFSSSFTALTVMAGPESLPSGKEMKSVVPVPDCDYTWRGFYVGLNLGYGLGNADTQFDPLPDPATFVFLEPQSHDADPGGVVGGGQVGFNWQIKRWLVIGAEADFQGSGMDGSKTISPVNSITGAPTPGLDGFLFTRERTDWFGTVRGRIGFTPWCRLLIYGTGGLAFGNVHYSGESFFSAGGAFITHPASFDRTSVGWTAGGGLEYALTHHWSLKCEYLYYDLGDQSATGPELTNGITPNPFYAVRYNWETTANIVRAGVNFKF
jgi:outer membrane immunogenic protein